MGGENIISTARQHDPSSQSDWGCRGTQIQSGGGGGGGEQMVAVAQGVDYCLRWRPIEVRVW
jgi:hypothetical protein